VEGKLSCRSQVGSRTRSLGGIAVDQYTIVLRGNAERARQATGDAEQCAAGISKALQEKDVGLARITHKH